MLHEKPSHELSIGEIITRSFRLYRAKFILFFLPFLIVGIANGIFVSALFSYLPLPPEPSHSASLEIVLQWFWNFVATLAVLIVVSGMLSAVTGAVATGMVIKCASDILEKGSSTLQEGLRFAMSKLVSLVGVSIIVSILVTVGMFLFYFPGIIFMIMFSLAVPAVVIEKKGVFESLGRSRKLVSHRWGKILVLFLIIGCILMAVSWISTLIIGLVLGRVSWTSAAATGQFETSNLIVTSVIAAFVTPIMAIATTFLYYSMIAREASQLPPPPPPF